MPVGVAARAQELRVSDDAAIAPRVNTFLLCVCVHARVCLQKFVVCDNRRSRCLGLLSHLQQRSWYLREVRLGKKADKCIIKSARLRAPCLHDSGLHTDE